MRKVWILWILIFFVAVSEGAAWWRLSERSSPRPPRLALSIPPSGEYRVTKLPIIPRQVGDLSFDRGHQYRLELENGAEVNLLCLEFDSGKPTLRFDLFGHPPEACLRNAGGHVEKVFPEEMWEVGDESFLIRKVQARDARDQYYIFKVMWFPGIEYFAPRSGHFAPAASTRLMRVFLSELPPGILYLISVQGAETYEEARKICLEYGLKLLSPRPVE